MKRNYGMSILFCGLSLAAAGLAAGGAAALATTKYDFCIPQNGHIALKLTSDAKV